jgi:CheY-like chemotaxis protein
MARVTALIPDLLFGSRAVGLLERDGHEVELISSEPEAWDQIAGTDVLVVDLTTDDVDVEALVDTLRTGGELHGTKVLGFYAHVEPAVRDPAHAARVDKVVPRGRRARAPARGRLTRGGLSRAARRPPGAGSRPPRR